jgi:GTP-binding protein
MAPKNIRNICIIAHVDHGKTTLVDFMLRQTGGVEKAMAEKERVMDSMDQEQERGITIAAKNASVQYQGTKINIIDTPGHADFGGEVERIISMADGAILLVDAVEGPLPQTRFVLEKALRQGLKIILLINKVDRPECADGQRIHEVINHTFDLFIDLGASEDQADFPLIYACAKDGWATLEFEEIFEILAQKKTGTLKNLFDLIVSEIPPPPVKEDERFQMLISNLGYSNYVGRLAIGRVLSGKIERNQKIIQCCLDAQGKAIKKEFSVSKIYTYSGLETREADSLEAGEIGSLAGSETIEIGDTLNGDEFQEALPRISVEQPNVAMIFSTNTSPFSGREGKAIQPRQLGERLLKESKTNVALRVEETEKTDQFRVFGRGELQFAILIEQLRRENLEFMVGTPLVLYKTSENGGRLEPMEKAVLDFPEEFSGEVTQLFNQRKGILSKYETHGHGERPRVRLEFEIPTRGLLGIRSRYLTVTRGEGLMSSEALPYGPYKGDLNKRNSGALIADREGKTTEYALMNLEDRGVFFVDPGVQVYEGMIVGQYNKETDLNVHVCRERKLTNVRAAHAEILVTLKGIRKMSLEECLEWLDEDEWIEVTPKNIRLRKKVLALNQRSTKRSQRVQ